MMHKVIEDMARGIVSECAWNEDEDQYELYPNQSTCSPESAAKAAHATLPEFIVLDEDAEPMEGDWLVHSDTGLIIFEDDWHKYQGNREIITERGTLFDYDKIIQRKGVPVLIRKKEAKELLK